MSRPMLRELLVFFLLVAIGVAGRWGQPQWHFTPLAAVAVFAGFFFSSWGVALLVPLAVRTLTDLGLPAHDHIGVLIFVYLTTLLPVWLGRMLRQPRQGTAAPLRWAACGLLPAVLFYVTTNFAVFALKSDYEASLAGMLQCYWMAVPFFRWMLAGDMFYLGVLFGCYAVARRAAASTAPVESCVKQPVETAAYVAVWTSHPCDAAR